MTVYIVGSGPGDPELVTLKAKRLIEEAEILIYDRLVHEEILNWVNPECKIIYMGKRDKKLKSSQQIQKEINLTLIKYSHNYRVVRLKGGDPFIFGRGGEEALVCKNAGINFEIIPGISSFYAVPAYAGIPITHRKFNSVFAVLTGCESIKAKSAINWEKLPETIIVLMGVSEIQEISKKLLKVGRKKSTPVAAISWGTTPKQQTKLTTIGNLAEGIEGLEPPTIFVIGSVSKLHEKLNWFERKLEKLKDKKIVIARAKNHTNEDEEILNSYKIKSILMPLIEIVYKEFELPNLNDFDAIVFTSVEGVNQVSQKVDLRTFSGEIFAIGPKTKNYILQNFGLKANIGKKYNSKGLGKHIVQNLDQMSKVLLLRSSAATKTLKNMLSTKFYVSVINVYDVRSLPANPDIIKEADAIFVMSASCAKSLSTLDKKILEKPVIVSIGPETSKYLSIPHLTAKEFTFQGIFNTYLNHIWSEKL